MNRTAAELQSWFLEALLDNKKPSPGEEFFRPILGTKGVWVDMFYGKEAICTVLSYDKELPLGTGRLAYEAAKKEYEQWKNS